MNFYLFLSPGVTNRYPSSQWEHKGARPFCALLGSDVIMKYFLYYFIEKKYIKPPYYRLYN